QLAGDGATDDAGPDDDGAHTCQVPTTDYTTPPSNLLEELGVEEVGSLLERSESNFHLADLRVRPVPLDEDRALVAAVRDDPLAVALADAEIHRPLHAQEATGRNCDRAGEEPLEQRLAQARDVERAVERPYHVVFRVVERLRGDLAGMREHVPPLFRREAERV